MIALKHHHIHKEGDGKMMEYTAGCNNIIV